MHMSTSQSLRFRFAALRFLALGLVAVVLLLQYDATGYSVEPAKPAVEGGVVALVKQHDCWTGNPPADMVGQIPGHVVVTVDGTTRYGGERMVGKALDQLFAGKAHGLTVHAFCR